VAAVALSLTGIAQHIAAAPQPAFNVQIVSPECTLDTIDNGSGPTQVITCPPNADSGLAPISDDSPVGNPQSIQLPPAGGDDIGAEQPGQPGEENHGKPQLPPSLSVPELHVTFVESVILAAAVIAGAGAAYAFGSFGVRRLLHLIRHHGK
jgi:hypothetical protein